MHEIGRSDGHQGREETAGCLSVGRWDRFLEIRLLRGERHNALDEDLIKSLTRAFEEAARDEDLRGILLSAEGKSFCAGADLNYMARVAAMGERENHQDALRLAGLFRAVRGCPILVVARVQGAALGGGAGLVACCDLVIASSGARFGFTEVRLGIVPAVISPFVLDRIGEVRARALFATGEIFDAEEARRIGLCDRVTPPEMLDGSVAAVFRQLQDAGPRATREAKALAGLVRESRDSADLFERAAATIARLRASVEGREGIAAFLEKRKPSWAVPADKAKESGGAGEAGAGEAASGGRTA